MRTLESYLGNPTRRSFLKGIAAVGAAAATVSVLPGCGGGDGGAGGKTFRWAQANAKLPLDMQRSNNSTSSAIAEAVVEGLFYWNDDMELELALAAEEPTWSEDGLTLTVKLKEDVKFHNGADFTAEDVKYTFTRMFKPDTAGLNTYMYDSIVGAEEMLAGSATELEGVEVVDDHTVAFHLTTPFAQFKSNLGVSYAGIFPHEACEEAGSDWGHGTNLIGTGPYKLTANDESSQVVLEANADYRDGAPNLDKIEISYIDDVSTKMMSFVNGELEACDLDSSLLEQYQDDATVSEQIHYYDTLGTYFIVMNLQDARFQDVRVRQALSLAIDRQSFIDSMLGGAATPCSCFLAPAIPGSSDEEGAFAYDPEQAKALLAEAGVSDLTFTVICKSAVLSSQMTAIQAMWEEVGVHAEIQQVDPGLYTSDQAAGNLECFLQGWFPLYADADNNMYSYFHSSASPAKSSFYSNAEFDALMDEGRREQDDEKRAELYKQADHILTREDYGCIPVYWPKLQFVAKDNVEMKCGNLIYHFNDVKMS